MIPAEAGAAVLPPRHHRPTEWWAGLPVVGAEVSRTLGKCGLAEVVERLQEHQVRACVCVGGGQQPVLACARLC